MSRFWARRGHMSKGFIPRHDGYKKLLSYQKSEIVFDATVYFCKLTLEA